MFRFGTHVVGVIYDMEARLYFGEKRERFAVALPVTKQRQCFTDDIPGDIKTGPLTLRPLSRDRRLVGG